MKKITLEDLKESFDAFCVDAEKDLNGNKAAGVRARIASVKLRDELKEWRLHRISKLPKKEN